VELDRGVFRQGVFERAERREKKRGRGPGQWVTVAAPCPGTFQAKKKERARIPFHGIRLAEKEEKEEEYDGKMQAQRSRGPLT